MNPEDETPSPARTSSPAAASQGEIAPGASAETRAVSPPPRPWQAGESLLMAAPGLITAMLAFVLGAATLVLGLMLTLGVAVYGASRAAEHRPNNPTLVWLGAFVGICLLNVVLAFGGCVVVLGAMRP